MTASSIKARSFSAVRNGYDPAEVKDFLEEIAAEYEAALKAKEENDEKVKNLTEELAKYREDEDAIKNALVLSQKEAGKIIADAKSQARDMIESAKTEEIRLREQSSTECERITKEYHDRCAEMIKQETEKTKQKIDEINTEYRTEKARFDELKQEVSKFKADLLPLYKKQISLIMQIPQVEETEDTSAAKAEAEAKAAEEAAAKAEAEKKAAEAAAEKEHIDKILNTGSLEKVLPQEQDLKFGKNK